MYRKLDSRSTRFFSVQYLYNRISDFLFLLPDNHLEPINLRKCLFTGTVPVNKSYPTGTVRLNKNYPTGTVPMNKIYPTGTVPVNKNYPTGTLPVNKNYPTGTVPVNKNYPTGTLINKLTIFSSKNFLPVCLLTPNEFYFSQGSCKRSLSQNQEC